MAIRINPRTGAVGTARDLHTTLDTITIKVPADVEKRRRQWLAVRGAEPVVEPLVGDAMADAVTRWVEAAPTNPDVPIRHPIDLAPVISAEKAEADAERAHRAWTLAHDWSAQWFVAAVNKGAGALIEACGVRADALIPEFHAAARAIPAGFAGGEQLAYADPKIREDYVKAAAGWAEWVALVRFVNTLDNPPAPADGWNPLAMWLAYTRTDFIYEHREIQRLQGNADLAFGLDLARKLDVDALWFPRGALDKHRRAEELWPPRPGYYAAGPVSSGTWIAS